MIMIGLSIISLSGYAQKDTIDIRLNSDRIILSKKELHSNILTYPVNDLLQEFKFRPVFKPSASCSSIYPPKAKRYNPILYTDPIPLSMGEYKVAGILKQFRKGTLVGAGSQTNLISLGIVNRATFGYYHKFNDKISANINANVFKFRTPLSSNLAYGVSSSFLYTPQENLRFKIFGNYSSSPFPAMRSFQYGGTMTVDISDRFGTEIGVQRYYDPIKKHWETVPIVIPYYKFDNFTLGMDVGGIIYEILYYLINK